MHRRWGHGTSVHRTSYRLRRPGLCRTRRLPSAVDLCSYVSGQLNQKKGSAAVVGLGAVRHPISRRRRRRRAAWEWPTQRGGPGTGRWPLEREAPGDLRAHQGSAFPLPPSTSSQSQEAAGARWGSLDFSGRNSCGARRRGPTGNTPDTLGRWSLSCCCSCCRHGLTRTCTQPRSLQKQHSSGRPCGWVRS